MEKVTILIADDHLLVRETWSIVLNTYNEFKVVGEAGTARQAIELAKELRPDVVLMDINLPDMNGIEATRHICKVSPASCVLGVSMHTQPSFVREMIQKGAMGYLTKNSSKEEMLEAIAEVKKGNKYLCKEIKNIIAEQVVFSHEKGRTLEALSQRELQVAMLIKKGQSSREIAEALEVTVKTVEVHRYNIMKKLKLKNTAALVNFINESKLN